MRIELPEDFPLQPLLQAIARVANEQGCSLSAEWSQHAGANLIVRRDHCIDARAADTNGRPSPTNVIPITRKSGARGGSSTPPRAA